MERLAGTLGGSAVTALASEASSSVPLAIDASWRPSSSAGVTPRRLVPLVSSTSSRGTPPSLGMKPGEKFKPVNVTSVPGTEITTRFNLFRSVDISGAPARGYTAGQALAALEAVFAHTMPTAMGVADSSLSHPEEVAPGRKLVERHLQATGSRRGQLVLDAWPEMARRFVRIIPNDYRRVLEAQARFRAQGLPPDEAVMAAFWENTKDEMRAGGN